MPPRAPPVRAFCLHGRSRARRRTRGVPAHHKPFSSVSLPSLSRRSSSVVPSSLVIAVRIFNTRSSIAFPIAVPIDHRARVRTSTRLVGIARARAALVTEVIVIIVSSSRSSSRPDVSPRVVPPRHQSNPNRSVSLRVSGRSIRDRIRHSISGWCTAGANARACHAGSYARGFSSDAMTRSGRRGEEEIIIEYREEFSMITSSPHAEARHRDG